VRADLQRGLLHFPAEATMATGYFRTAKMEQVLSTIPFDDLLASVRAFHLDSCREQPELASLLRGA
jgi:hypothetical protein